MLNSFWGYSLLLIPSILSICFVKKYGQTELALDLAIQLIAWTIVLLSILGLFNYLIPVLSGVQLNEVARKRWFGPYAFAYWIMFIGASILPLTLLFKNLRRSPFYLIFILICMNIGVVFERMIILISLSRDGLYATFAKNISIHFIIGIVLSFLFILIAEIWNRFIKL